MKIDTSFSAALGDFNDIDLESDPEMTLASTESSPISPGTVTPRFVGLNDNGELWVLSLQGPVLKFPAKFWSRFLSTIFLTL